MEEVPSFKTSIWQDIPEDDNAFVAKQSVCHGYDVFGDVLGNATFSEYLMMLFTGNKPSQEQVYLFDCMAVALGNAGPRDLAIRAAMNSGVGGAPAAANLMSFLSVAAGNYEGGHELHYLVSCFKQFHFQEEKWLEAFKNPNQSRLREDIWEKFEHPPGFLPHASKTSAITLKFMDLRGKSGSYPAVNWLHKYYPDFEEATGMAVSTNFVAAACFYELGFSPEQAELCSLIIRLPGAAVHSLEAKNQGWKQFPFFGKQTELTSDPGVVGPLPDVSEYLK
ncbi:hypothetical protein [Planctobacterium marinum]|uniref:Citrate synthase n=1 Tax=Planctobacterium marinum TaxID=1631968 RepID=A0AA48KQS6_9ALTE|nr:hypothetical protein MACH26_23040 [Planctobacterium marinum]